MIAEIVEALIAGAAFNRFLFGSTNDNTTWLAAGRVYEQWFYENGCHLLGGRAWA